MGAAAAAATTAPAVDAEGGRGISSSSSSSRSEGTEAEVAPASREASSPPPSQQPQRQQAPASSPAPPPTPALSSPPTPALSSQAKRGIASGTGHCVDDDDDPLTCPLLVGDLVRVSDEGQKFSKRLKDRGTYLGRVKSIAEAAESTLLDGTSISSRSADAAASPAVVMMYEVEWVLGGRLQNVRRQDLVKRTAVQEGYTEQRKRSRPTQLVVGGSANPASAASASRPAGGGGGGEGGHSTKKADATTKKKSSTSSSKASELPLPGGVATTTTAPPKSSKSKAGGAGASASGGGKKSKPSAKPKPHPTASKRPTAASSGLTAASSVPAASKGGAKRKRPTDNNHSKADPVNGCGGHRNHDGSAAASVYQEVQEMYDRHKRDFERVLARLEKVDKFGFFLDPAPPEYDECYEPSPGSDPGTISSQAAPERAATPTPTSAVSGTDSAQDPLVPSTPMVSNPPSTLDAGVTSPLDFLAAAAAAATTTSADAASAGQTATLNSVDAGATTQVPPPNKKRRVTKKPKPSPRAAALVFPDHAPFNWAMVRRRMERGRYVLDREKHVRANAARRVAGMKRKAVPPLHRLGVDWDLFLRDVCEMCDMALENDRDSDGDNDEDGSHAIAGENGVVAGDGASPGVVNGISPHLPKSPPRLERGSLAYAVKQIKEVVKSAYERTGLRQMNELTNADNVHKFMTALRAEANAEAAMQTWRTTPFPERRYERIRSDVVCDGLSPLDERVASYELKTNLPDSFVGLSYRYDDTGQSEAWMKSVMDEAGGAVKAKVAADRKSSALEANAREAALALAADDGVIRAQVNASMQTLLISVQDRVMTSSGVLHQPELKSANWIIESNRNGSVSNPELVEKPVWGIDCYTRRNIILCLEADFDSHVTLQFIEKWLLPAINSCPDALATNIGNAARILEGLPFEPTSNDEQAPEGQVEVMDTDRYDLLRAALMTKIRKSAPKWLKPAAAYLRRAREALGPDFFRVHPKGHGSILLSPVGANSLVTFYRGELYPSWRWGEKMDAIEITQQRKDLKPALPDFYNMILERPQSDPRGYGLLFVDASRKAGHGSSLSHSCDPACEVRVAALNGELCLAMTTLRELDMGEELTFDYNAVTESLNEYRSAVCLCGYGKCRGSFLHFSTADCYQQVLNRNAPVACRFANLVKGSMKLVMSDDDERVLLSHGFRTAAFGAISVNRRQYPSLDSVDCDSLDFVPVWLRTFVADTLRYIEYERRALPIALICDHLSSMDKSADPIERVDAVVREPTKPEPSFFYFTRTQADFVNSLMKDEGIPDSLVGLARRHAFNKIAASYWQTLPSEKKEFWKLQSAQDFERRLKAWKVANEKGTKGAKKAKSKKPGIDDMLRASKMSFQDADAEGISAMEQRIQQLTQSLSRIGRVLDRHREWTFEAEPDLDNNAQALRKRVHSPIALMSDSAVIGWIWNSSTGVLQPLIEALQAATWSRPELLYRLSDLREKYSDLEGFDDATDSARPEAPYKTVPEAAGHAKARSRLRAALKELRSALLLEVKEMGKIFKTYQGLMRRESSERNGALPQAEHEPTEDDEASISDESHVAPVENDVSDGPVTGEGLQDEVRSDDSPIALAADSLVPSVVRNGNTPPKTTASKSAMVTKELQTSAAGLLEANPWLAHYGQRSRLLALADLVLFYACTTNFFVLQPYLDLKSTPIEVYARELGNAVPRSAMDATSHVVSNDQVPTSSTQPGGEVPQVRNRPLKSSTPPPLCEPDEVIAKVAVSYSGDFVLSQLLQWYNGGIGLKPGLPDMSGCAVLPTVQGCVSSVAPSVGRFKSGKSGYEAKVRPRLIEWLQDPYQRGSPWPEDVRKAFVSDSDDSPKVDRWQLFGSPIVDFLVTGDESNIQDLLGHLDGDDKVSAKASPGALMLSVDKGRPAQAVSNWVQCENPECMKWRKIPWHVDVDLLPATFHCEDNKWDPKVSSCDAPEDDWDEDDKLVGGDGKVEGSPVRKDRNASLSPAVEENFFIGARFDVMRTGKSRFTIGTVTKVDLSGKVKRIRFHFHRCKVEADEWVEFGSPRIAPLYSKVPKDGSKGKHETAVATSVGTGALPESATGVVSKDGSVESLKLVSEVESGKTFETGAMEEEATTTSALETRNAFGSAVVATSGFLHSDSRETDALAAMMSLASGLGAMSSPSDNAPGNGGGGVGWDVAGSQSGGMAPHSWGSRQSFAVKEEGTKATPLSTAPSSSNATNMRYGAATQSFGPASRPTVWAPGGGSADSHHFDPAARKQPPPREADTIDINHNLELQERQLRELWRHQQLLRQGEIQLNAQRGQLLALGMGSRFGESASGPAGLPGVSGSAAPLPALNGPPLANLTRLLGPSTSASSSSSSSAHHPPPSDHQRRYL